MQQPKYNYDKEADVLYISFGISKQATYVELGDHLILRLEKGKGPDEPPRAVGLTILYPAYLQKIGHIPSIPAFRLKQLRPELRAAVLEVLTKPPLSDILKTQLLFTPEKPTLSELVAAQT
ncbi:MAG: DUF2283 domain-containing protein [Methyloligellaceae bacterium]